MAYKVYYGPKGRTVRRTRRKRIFFLVLLFFALFSYAAWKTVPDQLLALRACVFPAGTLEEMLEQMRSGEDLVQVIGAFCQEIWNGS